MIFLISQGLIPRSSAANKLSEAEANTPQLAAGKFIYVIVIGMAYTLDDFGNRFRAANVKIDCTVTDEQWEKDGRYDLAYVSGSTVTDSEGVFRMIIGLNPAKGGIQYDNGLSWHYYDLMRARITTPSNSSTENIKYFYLFKKSIIHSVL